MRQLILVTIAVLSIAAAPPARPGNANANANANSSDNGNQGCSSFAATGSSPGQWFQGLRDYPLLQGLTPKEMTVLENTTPGFEGYGQTPTVGAAIDFFCGD